MWRELTREFRWFTNSRAAVWLLVAVAVLAIWGAVSGITSTLGAIAAFRATLARYQENGEDIGTALSSSARVESTSEGQLIDNALRYDLDQAALAFTQLQPLGAIASTLSLCALLAFPVVGFALGIFVATHDVKSGAIIARWPQSGVKTFGLSKPLAVAIAVVAMTLVVAALTAPLSWVGIAIVSPQATDIKVFEDSGPSVGRVAVIASVAVLAGWVAGALGLLVGSVTRNRTFTIAVFSVAYLLVPILGPADPRNLLSAAGAEWLYFVGQFRPAPIGDFGPFASWGLLITLTIVFCAFSVAPWLMRARTERVA